MADLGAETGLASSPFTLIPGAAPLGRLPPGPVLTVSAPFRGLRKPYLRELQAPRNPCERGKKVTFRSLKYEHRAACPRPYRGGRYGRVGGQCSHFRPLASSLPADACVGEGDFFLLVTENSLPPSLPFSHLSVSLTSHASSQLKCLALLSF